ncbi:MAG: DUF1573 domain-containing protein [Desulfobacterales bacterium]|nr:DUF1573 domain-containing protein [Desulfobacterales bacterium]
MPPGGEGKITVKVNTTGVGGRKLSKNITVHTNDKKNPRLKLKISGDVKKFATITPKRVHLRGTLGKPIKIPVSIIQEEKYPFKILEVRAENGKNISYKLEEVEKTGKAEYKLIVENKKKEVGKYSDSIILKTDSEVRPEIKIRVSGNISAEKIATIKPRRVKLFGTVGKPIKTSVTIIPEKNHSFKILEIKAGNGENISWNLEEIKKMEKSEYKLTVENKKKEIGRYSDNIILKTDNNIQPEIKIRVSGNIFDSSQKDPRNFFKNIQETQKKKYEIATIIPGSINLFGTVGKPVKTSVDIIPENKHRFKILEVKAENGKNISYKLEEVKKEGKTKFTLIVENKKKDIGRYSDNIILKTDSKIRPEINIRVSGNISDPVQALRKLFEMAPEQQKEEKK